MALTNSQYKDIMRIYDEERLKNKKMEKERLKTIYEKHPKIKEIDEQIASCSIKRAKQALLNKKQALSLLKQEIDGMSYQKKLLLEHHGYPSDFLEPIYTCKKCKDTGYINNKKCSCFETIIIDLLYSQSNIKQKLELENFSHFNYKYYSDEISEEYYYSPHTNIENVVSQCKLFIKTFDTEFKNILFKGKTGVGKTFLCNCIAKELLDSNHSVIYLTCFQLFEVFSKYAFDKSNSNYSNDNYLNYILDCDLLIIDDLGAEFSNRFTNSQLFLCLNERLLRKKSTIISTNLSIDELTVLYSERIVSRIIENYDIYNLYCDQDIRLIRSNI